MTHEDAELAWNYACRAAAERLRLHLTEEKQIEAIDVLNRLGFSINDRLTSTAGKAKYLSLTVEISGPIFRQTYVLAQLIDTILHEIAHHLALRIDGETGHGPTWIKWAERIGCSAERTHSMPRARRRSQQEAFELRSELKL